MQFSGPDPAVLHRLADSARMIMARTPQVAQITTGWEPAVPFWRWITTRRPPVAQPEPPGYRHLVADGRRRYSRRDVLRRSTSQYDLSQMYGGRRLAHRQFGERTVFPMLPNVNALLDDELVGTFRPARSTKAISSERLAQTIPLGQVGRGVGIRWKIRSFRAITVSACRA